MYITVYKQNIRTTNLNLNYDSILQDTSYSNELPTYYRTTFYVERPTPPANLSDNQLLHIATIQQVLIRECNVFIEKYDINNMQNYYRTFHIPKRKGGLRRIDAPNTELMEDLTKLKDIFIKLIKCLPHDAAFAYSKNRSVKTELQRHQQNNSKWYLKVDLKDFFPTCTPEFVFNQLTQLYPFYYLNQAGKEALKTLIKYCCLNNSLPQGTPTSPILTNLCMVSYDYTISKHLKRGSGNHFVYTRYADDILISSKSNFNYEQIIALISRILTPFEIKQEKTRYGSTSGRNWNLGLMINKDNNITLGYRKKKLINAMINNFLNDYKNNTRWSREDAYALQGQVGYLKNIEPEYAEYLLDKYYRKHNIRYADAMYNTLNNIQ
jgi:hypothetical protein